jgi:alpha-L-fucosidase 2
MNIGKLTGHTAFLLLFVGMVPMQAQGDYKSAGELCTKMQGYFTESFFPLGDLHIRQAYENYGGYRSYTRELDISEAVATICFDVNME